ncbi:MAG TPA: xanthine dehydrogenase [Desulfotomaculum sp.]|nr:MAG: Xanthine and CO dehydrogenases maturation factor XdhC/CoxF family-like protein [Desulfotomaculum sp. 46_80]KUK84949.1 MAG: Xanthine and CO dehydrogenases maturation factor XdhC/CoxF family-like protein [Desulfofundulus kuznetsovii]HAG10728.1 xanthine dehydrogenase [Desulfotomaculum sp.]HBY03899.1 xanthine dehydrogenase [Desulfotomaculum sp.]
MEHVYKNLLDALKTGDRPVLVTLVSRKGDIIPPPGSKQLFLKNKEVGNFEADWLGANVKRLADLSKKTNRLEKADVFFPGNSEIHCTLVAEPVSGIERLIVLGGGNIAIPLVRVGSMLGYSVTVVDDRPEYANIERFPEAQEIICGDFSTCLENMSIDSWTSVVIITRGHQSDLICLEKLSGLGMAYLGMIGSKRKVEICKKHLQAIGTPNEKIEMIRAPIGLDIGAQTPEEIAVSIAAELIKDRRCGGALSMSKGLDNGKKVGSSLQLSSTAASDLTLFEIVLSHLREGIPLALATVVSTSGSTPRKSGAKMLVFSDGGITGTIGGGIIEEKVRQLGVSVLETGQVKLCAFQLDNKAAGSLGMVCGGDMEVFIEPVMNQ